MTRRANLFGIETGELGNVRMQVEKILGVSLEAHDSEYHGGDYFKGSGADFNIVLQTNFMQDDGEPAEAEFPHALLLLYVNGDEARVNKMDTALIESGFKLLRSSTF